VVRPEPSAPADEPTGPSLELHYEDSDLVVLEKPVGLAVHPSPGWTGGTVIGRLAAAGIQVSTSGAAERQGVVHRLDVGTSGLMMVAKSEVAYSRLKDAFRQRTVHKIYHALVQGHPDPLEGTIDAPIGRHPTQDYRWAVVSGGKDSITHYRVLEAFSAASLAEVELETGRTHQIRVHFAALRHPCVGDLMYAADPTLAARLGLTRQWLHATKLGFEHPVTGQEMWFESAYPADLRSALDLLAGT
jgi:23S rRNA pseudouridine1911/1915/1917 synthase